MEELNKGYEFTKAKIAELESLRSENAQLKNNHATEVRRARILKERTDMPIERVAAYEKWGEDLTELEDLRAWRAEIEKQEPARPDWYQNPTSEQWFECPDDAQILEDIGPVKVGDVIELDVCWNGKQKFRVAKISDEQSDDVEFDLVEGTKLFAAPVVSPDVEKLKAEIRELRMSRSLRQGQHEHEVQSLKAELAKATSELEAARKDAESWRSYKKRKDEVIAAGMGRNVLREAAIEQAKSCNELHEKGSAE